MKKILVPTDFSENAALALSYAIQMANQLGATITVLHAYHIASSAGNLVSIDHLVKADREQEVAELIEKMKPLLSPNARMEGQVKNGNPVDSIRQAAEKLKVDLIVMGTKGAGAVKKILWGSTASQVVMNGTLPTLVIPENYRSFRISTITLALDDKKLENSKVLRPILDLAQGFNAKLNLLTILNEDHPMSKIDPKLEDLLSELNVNYSTYLEKSPDIQKGIRDFVTRENSDLIGLVHHTRGFFQKIFETSVSREMSFDSNVPLLVMRG